MTPSEQHELEMFRASGDCVCSECGFKYWQHPFDQAIRGYDDSPYLHVICDGSRVKL